MNRVRRQSGLTLIELMIAITISLIVLAALTAMFVTSSRARDEITRANQQVENGRYAMQVLTDELRHAGYYGGYLTRPPGSAVSEPALPAPVNFPDPCATAVASIEAAIPLHVQGYNNGTNPNNHCGAGFATLTDYRAGTDVLVVRRASNCAAGTPNCADLAGELYFQASFCNSELDIGPKYRLSTSAADFDRHKRGPVCGAAPLADKRRFLVHIYYVADIDHDADAATADIPTLMRAELMGGDFDTQTPIAEGIEQLHFEYGIDEDGDGSPDSYVADPSIYDRSNPGTPVANCAANVTWCTANWSDTISVKAYVLARSTDPSPGHTDTKTYTLAGVPITLGGPFKRHVFESTVRLSNPAGMRRP